MCVFGTPDYQLATTTSRLLRLGPELGALGPGTGRGRADCAAGAGRLSARRAPGDGRGVVRLTRPAGYVEVPAFNAEPYAHHWFEKNLAAP